MLNQIDLSRVDLNLLVLFEIVFEEGHVGRAAERLNLSPSAVSHGLGRLRELLNDPLFLRNPKGVRPTVRALELSGSIAEILARARSVLSAAEPFDAARSTRRFVLAMNDGIGAVITPRLVDHIARLAPGIRIGVRDLLPPFHSAFSELDARTFDIAIAPLDAAPARFERRMLYRESFVVAMRKNHPLGPKPTLRQYCAARHVLVSYTGDLRGNIDDLLEAKGLSRHVALATPSFVTALTAAASTDLLAAAPERLARRYASALGLLIAPLPVAFPSEIAAIASRAAMMDAGVSWLMETLERVSSDEPLVSVKPGRPRSARP